MLVNELFETSLPDLRPRILVLKTSPETPDSLRLVDVQTRELIGLIKSPADFMRLINPQQKQHGADLVIKVPPQLYRDHREQVDTLMRFAKGMEQQFKRKIRFNLQGSNGISEDFPEHRRKERVRLGDLVIDIDEHLDDREKDRNLDHNDVLEVLSKIHHARRKIFDLNSGQKFWLYDPRLDTAIGMRLLNNETKRIMLKTALGKNPGMTTDVPVFTV